MKTKPIALLAAISLPVSLLAETYIIDFNDVGNRANNTDLRDASPNGSQVNDGGVATNGGSFGSGYDANTGLVHYYSSDITLASVPAGYTAAQGTAIGPGRAGFVDVQGRGRFQNRALSPAMDHSGVTWLSFFVQINPDGDADNEGAAFGGLAFGTNPMTSNGDSTPEASTGAFLGLTYIPAALGTVSNPAGLYLEYSSAGVINLNSLTTTEANVSRGVTSADLGGGAIPNQGNFIIAKLDGNANTLEAWLNPNDVTSEGALGAADLSTTLDITSTNRIGFGGMADDAATADLEHVLCDVDAIRFSNDNAAFLQVTIDLDPILGIDPAGGQNFDVGEVYTGSGSTTVTFVNESTLGNDINIDSVSITDSAGGIYTLGTVTYDAGNTGTPPNLEQGDKVTIEVIATSAIAGAAPQGEITIDTTSTGGVPADLNDATLSTNAFFFLVGEKLNSFPLVETAVSGWGGGPSFINPGIAPGSLGMMRLKGSGDPAGGAPDSAYQAIGIANGASDWQMTCYFTPINTSNFASYVDADGALGVVGPDAAFSDRTFQWTLQAAADESPGGGEVPNPDFLDTQAAATLINLAYLPDGADNAQSVGAPDHSGTADFYVFDSAIGSIGAWIPTGIGAIKGSIDNDTDTDPLNGFGDGLLDTTVDPGDDINVYQLVVTGTGFGTGAASYEVSVSKVSGSDTFSSASAAGITAFHGADGTLNTPTGMGFTTGDGSSSSNIGDGVDPGFTTPFWIDDICLFNGAGPDPLLTFLSQPNTLLSSFEGSDATTTFRVRNDGLSSSLNIASIVFSDPGFILSGAVPGPLAPGEFADLEVKFDPGISGSPLAGTMTITSDDSLTPVTVFNLAGVATSYAKLTANGDFETPGADNVTDEDTFLVWQTRGTATNVIDVPGLVGGSTTAAYIQSAGGFSELSQVVQGNASDFTIDFAFAHKGVARAFNIVVRQQVGFGGQVNIRYEGDIFYAFNNVSGAGWETQIDMTGAPLLASADNDNNGSLDDIGDVKNVYLLHFTAHNWIGGSPTWDLEVFDAGGAPLASNLGSVAYQNALPSAGFGSFLFSTEFGGSQGFWVDEVCAAGSAFVPELVITDFTIDPATGIGSVTFDSEDGVTYELRASSDASQTDPFSSNLVTSGPGTGFSTTLNFTDAGAVGQTERYYRIERP